jgi:threonine dehydrogenase-like Zn-dependent dehydrogenase
VDLLAAGAVDADIMISHRFGLDDYASAVDAFRAGTGRKLQILPGAS